MAADEKLMALKKAYADIILNTAKEAATRIMASERKAQRFQRELQAGKDEALRMMLRLKQMMDAKIADAELTSLSQQKKIDELEAQLQEAEDIVKDLREELGEVQSELDQLRNKQHPCESEQNNCHHIEYVEAADSRNKHQFQANESLNFFNAAPHSGNAYLGFHVLPSIISRSKESELRRNECTQGIRASEGNFSNRELSVSRKMSEDRDVISARDNIDLELISDDTSTVGNSGKFMKKPGNNQLAILHLVPSCMKKRRTTPKKKNIFSFFNIPKLFSADEAPGISYITTDQTSVRSNTEFHENSFSGLRLTLDQAESKFGKGSEEPSLNQSELGEYGGVHNSAVIVTEKFVPLMLETSENISLVANGEPKIDMADSLFPVSEPKESSVASELHSQPVSKRVIKYTFQRKRKRESLCGVYVDASPDKDGSKIQMPEKQSDPMDRDKADLIMESS